MSFQQRLPVAVVLADDGGSDAARTVGPSIHAWQTNSLCPWMRQPRAPTARGAQARCRGSSAPIFPSLLGRYDAEFAARLGKYRQQRIAKAVERFVECGDYSKGIARIKCTNAECKSEYFRPFSCKVFHLCPSCSQKRTLLFGEYMNERLLLRLPHRQIVFTFPKVLRAFFRHDHDLIGEVSRLAYRMIQDFYSAAAG